MIKLNRPLFYTVGFISSIMLGIGLYFKNNLIEETGVAIFLAIVILILGLNEKNNLK